MVSPRNHHHNQDNTSVIPKSPLKSVPSHRSAFCPDFLEFYIAEIIQCVFLLLCFFLGGGLDTFTSVTILRVIQMLDVLVIFSLLLPNSIPLEGYVTIWLSTHLLMDIWVVLGFGDEE